MSSVQRNLAEVPRTPTISSRLPHLNQTPRSGSKLPINQKSVQTKIPLKTPNTNTPSSRLLAPTISSGKSMNGSLFGSAVKSSIPAPKTPSFNRAPVTPSFKNNLNRGFNSARAAPNQNTSIMNKTSSAFKSNLTNRLTGVSNFQTPKRKSSLLDKKKISRTVDCAKSIKRRSIKILNQSSSRLSFLNEMESGCVLITPKLFQHLMSKSKNKIEESILEKDENENLDEEDLKVRRLDSNVLSSLFKKDETSVKNENNSIKVEITVNLNSNSIQSESQPVKIKLDTQKIEAALFEKDNQKLEAKLNEVLPQMIGQEKEMEIVIEENEHDLSNKIEPTIDSCESIVSMIEPPTIASIQSDLVETQNEEKVVDEDVKIKQTIVEEPIAQVELEVTNDVLIEEAVDNANINEENLAETIPFEVTEDQDRIEEESNKVEELIEPIIENKEDEVQSVEITTNLINQYNQEKETERTKEIVEQHVEKVDETNVEDYECKEISLQTDFFDESSDQPESRENEEPKGDVLKEEVKVEEIVEEPKAVENIIELIQDNKEDKHEEIIEEQQVVAKPKTRAVSKARKGRKAKNSEEEISNEKSDENNENSSEDKSTPVKAKRSRKQKEVIDENQEVKRVSTGQRVLTRAQRAKLAAKN